MILFLGFKDLKITWRCFQRHNIYNLWRSQPSLTYCYRRYDVHRLMWPITSTKIKFVNNWKPEFYFKKVKGIFEFYEDLRNRYFVNSRIKAAITCTNKNFKSFPGNWNQNLVCHEWLSHVFIKADAIGAKSSHEWAQWH